MVALRRQREIIALATAQRNACQYCLSAHVIGKGAGLTAEAISDALQRSRCGHHR